MLYWMLLFFSSFLYFIIIITIHANAKEAETAILTVSCYNWLGPLQNFQCLCACGSKECTII